MSQRRRQRRNRMRSEAEQYQAAAGQLMAMSGFEGGNQSQRRGWIYWPTLDSKRELNTYSRTEMTRKSRWLQANFGLPNRICNGLADLLGYLTPISMSGDQDWDRLADAHWEERAGSEQVMDMAGRFNINQIQIELNSAAFSDGDVLPVMVRQSTGGIGLAIYEGPQISSPVDAGKEWIDGVRINKFGRHVAYGLANGDGTVKTISANDALYYAHPDRLGRVRPPTILKHAINHLIDISEILSDVKLTIKVAAQLGLYVENADENSGGNLGPRALAGGLRNEQMSAGVTGSASNPAIDYKVEDFYKQAGGLANLPKGSKIGTIQDSRPHPNQINLLEYLVRDISWGAGVAPELIWNIEKLKGANNRLMSADLERWMSCRLLRLRGWLQRFRSVWIASEMEAGRLPEPSGEAKFWRASFLPQASLTADKGRVGQLNIELVKHSMRSLQTHFAEEGRYWRNELIQIAQERNEMRELGIALEDVVDRPVIPSPPTNPGKNPNEDAGP